jgi:hypothetical protein
MKSFGSEVEGAISLENLTSEQRAAIQKLLASERFASAPRLREVLAFLLHNLEEGTSGEITEQSIGQAVFGRQPGYNASEDNIVRVTVRHLRARLTEYYQTEGSAESLELVIPKGKYQPTFVSRSPSLGASGRVAETEAPVIADLLEEPATIGNADRTLHRLRWIALAVGACILAAFCGGYLLRSRLSAPSAPASGVLARLCDPRLRISVVLVDSNLQVYRSIFGLQVSLDDYLSRNYGNEPLHSADPRVSNALHIALDRNDTNVSSAIIGSAIERSLPGREVDLQHPRDVSMREFQSPGNVVLLGGPWVNPWGQLFEKRLNFRLLPLPNQPAYSEIHNVQPAGNEPTDFIPYKDGNLNVNFVRIAILPGFSPAGKIFLLGATSTESLEAGGEYLLSDGGVTRLLTRFHVTKPEDLPPLEVVLEVKGYDSVPGSRRIVASRVVPN